MSGFKKATKKQAKLRLAVFGPSGSGKTFSALRIAKGMNGKTAVIDSERGSASKYSDRFDFDVLELQPCNIDNLVKGIGDAEEAEYNILIIDSLTHAWQELLEEIDKLANAKYKGNSWGAWNEGTPKQKKLVNAILNYNGHIIATMRSKTEWTIEQTQSGKTKPVRVGLAPEQGKGIEYEFDMLMEITPEHFANIIKDRTGMFQDQIIEKPDEKFGKKLVEWLNSGEKVEIQEQKKPESKLNPGLQMYVDSLKSYMDTFELPEAAYTNLEKEITEEKITEKRLDEYKAQCEKFPLKAKYMATEEEILLFLHGLTEIDISGNQELLNKSINLEKSMKISKSLLQNLIEESKTCPKKVPAKLGIDSNEKAPEFGFEAKEVEDKSLPKGVL